MTKHLAPLALVSVVSACRAPESGAAAKQAPAQTAKGTSTPTDQGSKPVASGMFLTQADFRQPEHGTDLSAAELGSTINNIIDFYSLAETYYPPQDACILQMQKGLKATATKSQLTFDLPTADLTNCENTAPGLHPKDYQEVTMRLFAQVTCTDVDISQFNGITLDAFSSNRESVCIKGGSYIFATQATFKSASAGTLSAKSANLGSDSGPCALTPQNSPQGTLLLSDGCLTLNLVENAVGGVSKAHYSKLVDQHVAAGIKDTYYRSGSISFVIDNWRGTMSYSGAQSAPTWTAANSAGASSSGTFAFLPYGERLPVEPIASPSANAISPPVPALGLSDLQRQAQPIPHIQVFH